MEIWRYPYSISGILIILHFCSMPIYDLISQAMDLSSKFDTMLIGTMLISHVCFCWGHAYLQHARPTLPRPLHILAGV